jgi:hypothetical protein
MRLDCNDQMVTEPEDASRSYLAAGEARHFDEFSRVLHDGVVVHSPGGATYVGVDAQLAAWQAAHARLFLGIGPTGHRLQVYQALPGHRDLRGRPIRAKSSAPRLGVVPTDVVDSR